MKVEEANIMNRQKNILVKIKLYMENMIREYVSTGEWKLQLTISILCSNLFLLEIQNNFVLDTLIVKILKL